MPDQESIDEHLGAVLSEVIDAIQETKQAVWSASSTEQRRGLEELRLFLVDQATMVSDAEERLGGRSPLLLSPTGHRQRNLRAEAGGEVDVMLGLLRSDLDALAGDIRARTATIAGSAEAALLTGLADGIDQRSQAIAPRGGR